MWRARAKSRMQNFFLILSYGEAVLAHGGGAEGIGKCVVPGGETFGAQLQQRLECVDISPLGMASSLLGVCIALA